MSPEPVKDRGASVERRIIDALRRAGWKVERQPHAGPHRPDLEIRRGEHAYLVEVKRAPEGRRDRVLPLAAQAILQAQAAARHSPERLAPLAVVAADRVPEDLAADVERFAHQYAPDVAIGLVDLDGFRFFRGPGLESMNAARPPAVRRLRARAAQPASHLFSDLNQWMLKVLLAPQLPADMVAAPRAEYVNASQLAAAADVSVMSAFRFVRQLRLEGFLDESAAVLKPVRLEAFLRRWQAANLRLAREVPMRWVLRGDPARQLHDALRSYALEQHVSSGRPRRDRSAPRACLALFAAADSLGLGIVRGVAPHVYLEEVEPNALDRLGLSVEAPGSSPDVYVRVPIVRESVFRGAVRRDGVPVCDVLQVWLDAAAHPARGPDQADMIYRRVLRSLLEKKPR